MATYRSTVPRALGLNHSAGADPRLIVPGATFEAAPSEIPAGLLACGDLVLVKADPEPVVNSPSEPPPAVESKGKSK